MSGPKMRRRSEDANDLAWLIARTDDDRPTGYDASGWPRSICLLHAMYKMLVSDVVPTFDEVRRHRLQQGLETPTMVGSINLDEATVDTSVPLGYAKHPGPGWRRLRWRQLATVWASTWKTTATPRAIDGSPTGAGQPTCDNRVKAPSTKNRWIG